MNFMTARVTFVTYCNKKAKAHGLSEDITIPEDVKTFNNPRCRHQRCNTVCRTYKSWRTDCNS